MLIQTQNTINNHQRTIQNMASTQYRSGAGANNTQDNIPTMEQVLSGSQLVNIDGFFTRNIPYFSMTQLFQAAMHTGHWFQDHTDTPVDRIMRVVQLVLQQQDDVWTENEVVSLFLQNFRQALNDRNEANVIVQANWDSNMPSAASTFYPTLSTVSSRLKLARRALELDDPQLTMSIIMWRTMKASEYDEYNREVIPLTDIMYTQEDSQPNDCLLLVDSAYCPTRFPMITDELSNYIEDMLESVRKGFSDGFLRPIPAGVLLGISNHEARDQQFREYEDKLHAMIGQMSIMHIPVNEQIPHLEDLARSWSARLEDRNHTSWRLPPPISEPDPIFFRCVDPKRVVDLITHEIEWLSDPVEPQLTPEDSMIWDEELQQVVYFRNPPQAAMAPDFISLTPNLPDALPNTPNSPSFQTNEFDEPVDPTEPSLSSRPPTSHPVGTRHSRPARASNRQSTPPHVVVQHVEDRWPGAPHYEIRRPRTQRPPRSPLRDGSM